MSVIPVADAKKHLGIKPEDTSQDAALQGMLDTAEEIVSTKVGRLATSDPITEDVKPFRGTAVLRHVPVQSVTSVTIGGTATTGFTADLEAGLIHVNNPATVVYVAGFAAVPAAVREAVLDLVRLRYEARPGALPRGVEVAEEEPTPPFPPDDRAVLARLDSTPYRRGPSVG